MRNFRILPVQSLAYALLSSQIVGMDSPFSALDIQPPRLGGADADAPRTPVRAIVAPRVGSPTAHIPNRDWMYYCEESHKVTKPVVVVDLEFNPELPTNIDKGEISQITLYKLINGEAVASLHHLLRTNSKTQNPHVKSIFPVNPATLPTFAEVAPAIANFINGTILYSWGPSDPNKLQQFLSMQGGANGTIPTGTEIEFEHADGLQMERRDEIRRSGTEVISPAHKVFKFTVESPTLIRQGFGERSRKNRETKKRREKNKENERLDHEIKVLTAHAHGTTPPKSPTRRKVSANPRGYLSVEEVKKRKGVTTELGVLAAGLSPSALDRKHRTLPQHKQAHYSDYDARGELGILFTQTQPTLQRRFVSLGKLDFGKLGDEVDDVGAPKQALKRTQSDELAGSPDTSSETSTSRKRSRKGRGPNDD
jgi:hypothetical protein